MLHTALMLSSLVFFNESFLGLTRKKNPKCTLNEREALAWNAAELEDLFAQLQIRRTQVIAFLYGASGGGKRGSSALR